MSNILQHHFAMSKHVFAAKRAHPSNNLSIQEQTPTVEGIRERVGRVPWGWINKKIYDPEVLAERIKDPRVQLFDLYDTDVSDKPIGYALIVPPDDKLTKSFNAASRNENAIEIENLALFPDNEGGGRGWKFFTLVMEELYNTYDDIGWSQSSTNFETLKDYYIRKGMSYLGSVEVPDFQKPAVA